MRAEILKKAVQLVMSAAIMAACLFIPAGRVDWPSAWLLIGICTVGVAATFGVLMRRDPALMAERARGLKGGKWWDKVLSPAMALFGPMAIWITAGFHASWSATFPNCWPPSAVCWRRTARDGISVIAPSSRRPQFSQSVRPRPDLRSATAVSSPPE